jgi:hypothetical protein
MYLLNLSSLEIHNLERRHPLCNIDKIKAKRAFVSQSDAEDFVKESYWPKLVAAGLCYWCLGSYAKE